jgi:cell wall assembly regulator SMI1
VPLNAGATEQELSEFEIRFGLTLPPDFRYFYSQVNGMPDLESDIFRESGAILIRQGESPSLHNSIMPKSFQKG